MKLTYDFVHLLQGKLLMALLQPTLETFEFFNDILIIAEGRITYMRPRLKMWNFLNL